MSAFYILMVTIYFNDISNLIIFLIIRPGCKANICQNILLSVAASIFAGAEI